MNPLIPFFTAGALFAPVQPIAPQTYYISNLSETDGAKCGEYITITPIPSVQPVQITPLVIPMFNNQSEE